MLTVPPALRPGSLIGITCPSGYVARERFVYCSEVLQRWGFRVREGKTIGTGEHYMAGTDEERLQDLQSMLDDPQIDAVLMGRGGYGLSRIIDRLDFTALLRRPKWIWGFSDVTVLHSHLHQVHHVATLHAPMCGAFKADTERSTHILQVLAALAGEDLFYHTPAHRLNRPGEAEGILTGGNLAILAHLSGSRSAIDTDDKILFLEDVGEYKYNLDRMLLNLKRSGRFEKLKGLVLGGFTDTQDTDRPFGMEVADLIFDKVREYDYPVCFDFPAGHQDDNRPLRLGMQHRLVVTGTGAEMVQHFKSNPVV